MPKPYMRKMPATWWLTKRAYFWFMMRELTAVFVGAYCVLLLVLVWKLKQGSPAFGPVMDWLQTPWSIGFHFIALVAALYHALTWFALLPKVIVIRVGEEKLPPILLVGAHWLLWAIVTAGLVWIVFFK